MLPPFHGVFFPQIVIAVSSSGHPLEVDLAAYEMQKQLRVTLDFARRAAWGLCNGYLDREPGFWIATLFWIFWGWVSLAQVVSKTGGSCAWYMYRWRTEKDSPWFVRPFV